MQDIIADIAKHDFYTTVCMWNVSSEWRNGLLHTVKTYEDQLCEQFEAMRVNVRYAPKYLRRQALLQMKGSHGSFECCPYRCARCGVKTVKLGYCSCHRVPVFPWLKVLTGPFLSVTLILVLVRIRPL